MLSLNFKDTKIYTVNGKSVVGGKEMTQTVIVCFLKHTFMQLILGFQKLTEYKWVSELTW